MALTYSKPVQTGGGIIFKGKEHDGSLVVFINLRSLRQNERFTNTDGTHPYELTADVADLSIDGVLTKDVTVSGKMVVDSLKESLGETVLSRIGLVKTRGGVGAVVRPANDSDEKLVADWHEKQVKAGVLDSDGNVL